MRINGRSALACKENVGSELERVKIPSQSAIPQITVAPMGNMPVIKDLVVDMGSFWQHLEAITPFINTTKRSLPEREFLQTPEERQELDRPGNCILCGACYSECNAREVNPDFVGPHALAKAYRMVTDSRDDRHEERLEKYNLGTQGVWGCTRCYYCNSVCPMDVAPMDRIGQIKQQILADENPQPSRSIRHRKVLIDLVKAGGWIDERQFGLRVVGNSFRDLKGLISLGPLGLRMLARGKFPFGFEPSTGTEQVRSLIESVQKLESPSITKDKEKL
jgi:succinate dehydrogenase / fumarate reductase iron-sulfur subunit